MAKEAFNLDLASALGRQRLVEAAPSVHVLPRLALCVCVCARACVCVRACACACVRACMHACSGLFRLYLDTAPTRAMMSARVSIQHTVECAPYNADPQRSLLTTSTTPRRATSATSQLPPTNPAYTQQPVPAA